MGFQIIIIRKGISMIKADDYNYLQNFGKKIILKLNNDKTTEDVFLGVDYFDDNDVGDGFILAVDGDTSVGRLVLEKDVERVEFAN